MRSVISEELQASRADTKENAVVQAVLQAADISSKVI